MTLLSFVLMYISDVSCNLKLLIVFLCPIHCVEEKRADDDAFESDLIAGRLQEDVVKSI